jgi:hypothetical protein
LLLIKYKGEEIKVDGLGVSCSAYEGEEKGMLYFGGEIGRNEITRKTWYKWDNGIKMKMNGLKGCGLDSSG